MASGDYFAKELEIPEIAIIFEEHSVRSASITFSYYSVVAGKG
jgi:hypothetical protein